MSLRRTGSGYMAVTRVILPTRFSPLHMPVARMFVNTVSKMTTPRGIKALANGTPLVTGGDELALELLTLGVARMDVNGLGMGSKITVCKWFESKLHG